MAVLTQIEKESFQVLKFRSYCPYAYYQLDTFPLHQHEHDPLENLVVAEARVGAPNYLRDERRFFDRVNGIQLILHAAYENLLIRPFRALTNFVIVMKTILLNPSTRFEQRYLLS